MTSEQLAALEWYATRYGRTWKSKLLRDWETGEPHGDYTAPLRQVRNQIGPTGLMRLKLRKQNPRRAVRRTNPHRRRRVRPTLRSMMHVRRGARGLTDREARRLAQFERRYDRLVGHSRNPRRSLKKRARLKRTARRTRRSQNPRSPLFKLLAQRHGGKRLVYLGGVKFAERGRPVYFKTPEGARTVAKLLRLQFPMLRRYAFGVAGA